MLLFLGISWAGKNNLQVHFQIPGAWRWGSKSSLCQFIQSCSLVKNHSFACVWHRWVRSLISLLGFPSGIGGLSLVYLLLLVVAGKMAKGDVRQKTCKVSWCERWGRGSQVAPESSRAGHEPILQPICQGLMPGATEEGDTVKETIW